MDWDIFTTPFEGFLTKIMDYLPNVIAALVILIIAWILAKVLRSLVRKLMRATTIDKRLGKGGEGDDKSEYPVAWGTGTAVFWIVWIFFILAILEVLGLEGTLNSIAVLFERVFSAIPNILAAVFILVILYYVGRLLANLVTKLLTNIHFNELPVKLGITKQSIEGAGSPSSILGYIVMVFIMLFAIIMAADLLGFTEVNELVSTLTGFLALVVLGIIVIGIGIFMANLVANILKSGGKSPTMISVVKVFIIILSIAIGLRAMGFANDIILLIFGVMLAAIAVAAAIAFGLGGREVGPSTAQVVLPDPHQLIRILKGERLEKHRVENTEDRRIGADTQRHHQDGKQRECRLAEEPAESVSEVLKKQFHDVLPRRQRVTGSGVCTCRHILPHMLPIACS